MNDAASKSAADDILTVDRHVAHVSTVPAVAGETVHLFVRERAARAIVEGQGGDLSGRVVLMVHGGFFPSTVAFDLAFEDYSWMAALAAAGLDVFCIDMTGYGYSTRPAVMDDPDNLDPDQRAGQAIYLPPVPGPAPYPFKLVNSDSETADIDRVVDYIRELRGVDRIALIGWSGGGIRTGTYTVRHPDKVDRLAIFASSNYVRNGSDTPPAALPEPGVPVTFQSRPYCEAVRWDPDIRRDGQLDPAVRDAVWRQARQTDAIAAGWGPGGVRAPTRSYWGWTAAAAARIAAPTLVMVGEFDHLLASNMELHKDLGAASGAFLEIACASHFMAWEKQRRVLHRASVEWLCEGTLAGAERGVFRAGEDGRIAPA